MCIISPVCVLRYTIIKKKNRALFTERLWIYWKGGNGQTLDRHPTETTLLKTWVLSNDVWVNELIRKYMNCWVNEHTKKSLNKCINKTMSEWMSTFQDWVNERTNDGECARRLLWWLREGPGAQMDNGRKDEWKKGHRWEQNEWIKEWMNRIKEGINTQTNLWRNEWQTHEWMND